MDTHTQSQKLREMRGGRQEIKHSLLKAAEKFLGCLQAPQGEYAKGKCKQKISCPLLLLPSVFPSIRVFSNESALWEPRDCSMPGFSIHHQLPELAQTHVHRVGDAISHLTLCHPLLLLPSVFPIIRVFSSESVLHIMSFSLSISPSSEYSGWISLRFNWFDLPTVQGTLRSLLQHHS